MHALTNFWKPDVQVQSVRLLDQLRERIRYCHYSLGAERACSTLHPQADAGGCSLSGIARVLDIDLPWPQDIDLPKESDPGSRGRLALEDCTALGKH
jgi:hypothetical protein